MLIVDADTMDVICPECRKRIGQIINSDLIRDMGRRGDLLCNCPACNSPVYIRMQDAIRLIRIEIKEMDTGKVIFCNEPLFPNMP